MSSTHSLEQSAGNHTDRATSGIEAYGPRFRELAANHRIWSHPFLARCREGRLDMPQVRALAVQMYKFCNEFSKMLACVLSHCDDEQARVTLAANLWEELGEGALTNTHPELMRRFTRALGISDSELAALPATPETSALIRTYAALPQRFGVAGAVGALCYASEGLVAELYSQLLAGLCAADSFSSEDLIFFELHVSVDSHHADSLRSVLASHVNESNVDAVTTAIATALDARCAFFDGVGALATCT